MTAENQHKIPKYAKHNSGMARVRFPGRKPIYLGKYGSRQSKEQYARLVAEWTVNGYQLPDDDGAMTVSELIHGYWYAVGKNQPGGQRGCVKNVLRLWRQRYGSTPACKFGPKALKLIRQTFIEQGWSRRYVNRQVDRVRMVISWGVTEELLPGDQAHALRELSGLRMGEDGVRESPPVKPVPVEHVNAVLPFMQPAVAAMVRIQLLTGCRPNEVCMMRMRDLDTTKPVWRYSPEAHKTRHLRHERVIHLGPQAQELLRPYLRTELDAYIFQPREIEERRDAERRKGRKTPLYPSHVKVQAKKRKRTPKRAPGDRYDVHSYRRAIDRACKRADVPSWGPNRLRHTRATEVRRQFDLESARAVLGHRKANITEIYAERDAALAAAVALKIG